MSKMDCHLLRQKVRQRTSVEKTNTANTTQNMNQNANSLELLRFFDKLFDAINDNPFLML